jgi:hypothetical protein
MSTPIDTGLSGQLVVDRENGVITFYVEGVRILRITHLPDPIPNGVTIDLVALPALTSYTPMQTEASQSDLAPLLTAAQRAQNEQEEKSALAEWKERHGR